MTYFDSLLKKLYDEFKRVFNQDEIYSFRDLFKVECSLESIASKFSLLIDLTMYLLQEIQLHTNNETRLE